MYSKMLGLCLIIALIGCTSVIPLSTSTSPSPVSLTPTSPSPTILTTAVQTLPPPIPTLVATEIPAANPTPASGITVNGNPSSLVSIQLSMDFAPKVGEQGVINWTVSTVRENSLLASLTLPQGIKVVDGETEWHGQLAGVRQ